MVIWVSASWTSRSRHKVLLVSTRSHATGNSSQASSWRHFATGALAVKAVSSPRGQKENLESLAPQGTPDKRQMHTDPGISCLIEHHALQTPLTICGGSCRMVSQRVKERRASGESQAAGRSWSQALHLGSGPETRRRAAVPQGPVLSRPRSSGWVSVSGEEQRFSLLQPVPPAPPLLPGVTRRVMQGLSPNPAHVPVTSWAAKNILLEKAVCLTLLASLPGLIPNIVQAAFLPLTRGKRRGERAWLSLGTIRCAAQLSLLLLHWPENPDPPK